jgi:hypothetical protein
VRGVVNSKNVTINLILEAVLKDVGGKYQPTYLPIPITLSAGGTKNLRP